MRISTSSTCSKVTRLQDGVVQQGPTATSADEAEVEAADEVEDVTEVDVLASAFSFA